ncbi:hypothetical protein CB1_057022003 [Camelus ferus]|nr:hypothetical protein CB1_057022003 [Camelus ferus]
MRKPLLYYRLQRLALGTRCVLPWACQEMTPPSDSGGEKEASEQQSRITENNTISLHLALLEKFLVLTIAKDASSAQVRLPCARADENSTPHEAISKILEEQRSLKMSLLTSEP